MKHRAVLAFLVAVITSALVWAISPWLTGHQEPWDAEWFFYVSGLLLSGFITGVLVPKPLWAYYLGSIAGQLGYMMLFLPDGPLMLVGTGFLFVYSCLFLIGGAGGSFLRLKFSTKPKTT